MEKVFAINYLCVYAMIEMVLKDIGKKDLDQIHLANQFGVTLPAGEYIEGVSNVEYCTDERECGAHIDIDRLNSFFSEKGIPLNASYIKANPFDCYDKAERHDAHMYIIYLYSYGSLNNDIEKKNVGHASMKIDNIENGIVSIYDPGPLGAGIKKIRLNKMYDAISDCNGGILILERISK